MIDDGLELLIDDIEYIEYLKNELPAEETMEREMFYKGRMIGNIVITKGVKSLLDNANERISFGENRDKVLEDFVCDLVWLLPDRITNDEIIDFAHKVLMEDYRERLLYAFSKSFEKYYIIEGIDVDYNKKLVSYNPRHQRRVDTSVEHNPTVNVDLIDGVEVWSIFKRKKDGHKDGNPLIYAMKNDRNWKFRSQEDEIKIEEQIKQIIQKFLKGHNYPVTILTPSSNHLNRHIADLIKTYDTNVEIIEGAVYKLTVDEVDDIVTEEGSEFRKKYNTDQEYMAAYKKLLSFFREMKRKRKGIFTRHDVADSEMRNVLDDTMRASPDMIAELANKLNGSNVLIIDDTIFQGNSLKEMVKIIKDTYAPLSITVLTLFSQLK